MNSSSVHTFQVVTTTVIAYAGNPTLHHKYPSYQREYVFKEEQRQALLLSLLVGKCSIGLITANCVASSEAGSTWNIIDGRQRTETLVRFIQNQITIKLTPKLRKRFEVYAGILDLLDGHSYSDLPDSYKLRLNNLPVSIELHSNLTMEAEYGLFDGLNSHVRVTPFEQAKGAMPNVTGFLKECENQLEQLFGTKANYRHHCAALGTLFHVLYRPTDNQINSPTHMGYSNTGAIWKRWGIDIGFAKSCLVFEIDSKTYLSAKKAIDRWHKLVVRDYADDFKGLSPTSGPTMLTWFLIWMEREIPVERWPAAMQFLRKKGLFDKMREGMCAVIGSREFGGAGHADLAKKLRTIIVEAGKHATSAEYKRQFPLEIKRKVLKEQGGKCAICGLDGLVLGNSEADHIHPWSLGNPTTEDNCQVLCQSCNRKKGAK